MSCSIRMRDLSCGGASGLCDEPLDVGSSVTICLTRDEWIEAEVRWTERTNVGLKFTHPLPPRPGPPPPPDPRHLRDDAPAQVT
jgi:hypothetical protein